ncbi:MAG: hypothetical protein AAF800_05065 [Planctomycetota bacterium]
MTRSGPRSAGKQGYKPTPFVGPLDRQSFETYTPHNGSHGCDVGKNTLGRKRFLIVYTLRLIPGVAVTGADTIKRYGGGDVPIDIKGLYRRPKKVWSDGG